MCCPTDITCFRRNFAQWRSGGSVVDNALDYQHRDPKIDPRSSGLPNDTFAFGGRSTPSSLTRAMEIFQHFKYILSKNSYQRCRRVVLMKHSYCEPIVVAIYVIQSSDEKLTIQHTSLSPVLNEVGSVY